jgi:pimeloyl-ACP methyl ester carboxylesterase
MWLTRMGYRVFCSGIGLNADCPYLLTCRVANTVEYAYRATHERVHLIGHSLGGLLARAVAVMLPNRVQSLITLGSPFRGIVAHPAILCAARWVRCVTLERRAGSVPWTCFRDDCRCTFVRSLRCSLAPSIRQTAIYTKLDGVVDWRYCITGDHRIDRAVTATHSGLIVNPEVYELLARRLALPAC